MRAQKQPHAKALAAMALAGLALGLAPVRAQENQASAAAPALSDPNTALLQAAAKGDAAGVRGAFNQGAYIACKDPDTGETALLKAVRSQSPAAVEAVLHAAKINYAMQDDACGISSCFLPPLNFVNDADETALVVALKRLYHAGRGAQAKARGILADLLTLKADPNLPYVDNSRRVAPAVTPLILAAQHGDKKTLALLLEDSQTEPDVMYSGMTACGYAQQYDQEHPGYGELSVFDRAGVSIYSGCQRQ